MEPVDQEEIALSKYPRLLRGLSYFTCFMTFLLIFAGGLVKSTESGLAVPDWPLSYGMVFPPMVGGVLYEHGHRLLATFVGFLTLVLAVLLGIFESRKWVKILGWSSLLAVIFQGVLGGITVLFFLPTPISVLHGVVAQTFFVMTIIIAYSQSRECLYRPQIHDIGAERSRFLRSIAIFIFFIYGQLIIGAVMRHTQSGLAIPDFPTMGGQWIPMFNSTTLNWINDWMFEYGFDYVTMKQVLIHFLHRLGALVLLGWLIILNVKGWRFRSDPSIATSLWLLDGCFVGQAVLGMFTVLTVKEPILTSVHVAVGAATLGFAVLLYLRTAPQRVVCHSSG